MCTMRLPDGVTIVSVLPPESARHVGTAARSVAAGVWSFAPMACGTAALAGGAEVGAGLSSSALAVNGGGQGIGRDTSTLVAGVRMCSVLPSELDEQVTVAPCRAGGIGRMAGPSPASPSTAKEGGQEIGRNTSD